MRLRRASLLAVVLLAGCGAATRDGSTAPRGEVVGNDAVRARLTALPPLPIAPSTEVRASTGGQARQYCAWQAEALGAADVSATCPDGSTVRIDAACDGPAMDAMREGFAICAMTIGEWAACVAARREAPCDGGVFGERLPECEAFAACISAAIAAEDASRGHSPSGKSLHSLACLRPNAS